MNLKILNKLEQILQENPELFTSYAKLKDVIFETFGVSFDYGWTISLETLAYHVDQAVMTKYFGNDWQPDLSKFTHSGWQIVDKVNALTPKRVLDVGCGYNPYKGKIIASAEFTGVDPFNANADKVVDIMEFGGSVERYDVVLALGSINFGSSDVIYKQLDKIMSLTKSGGHIFLRVNPYSQLGHDKDKSQWVDFYPWSKKMIYMLTDCLPVELLELEEDGSGARLFFVWERE